jgi:hypothetical protein
MTLVFTQNTNFLDTMPSCQLIVSEINLAVMCIGTPIKSKTVVRHAYNKTHFGRPCTFASWYM